MKVAVLAVIACLVASGLPAEESPPASQTRNQPCRVDWRPETQSLQLIYRGRMVLDAHLSQSVKISSQVRKVNPLTGALEQTIMISAPEEVALSGRILGGPETVVAETRGPAQQRFPLVRTSHGLSCNRRNNAVYDRTDDWMIEGPQEAIRIDPLRQADGTVQCRITVKTQTISLVFRPCFYQKHKNLPYYQPWTYSVRQDSITGWCSWWAYSRHFQQKDLESLLAVWQEKHLGDYGYRFIQIDDGYQGALDGDRRIPENARKSYIGGRPETWLNWRSDRFPGGMTGYVQAVKEAGFEPGVWMGCFFTDLEIARQHPDWFICGPDGRPFVGDWVTYAIDATYPEAVDSLIRPTFHGIHEAGFAYVKIDQLRHYLYDNLNLNLADCRRRGVKPAEIFRAYLRTARRELGADTFMLSCWGVLPESVGLADACRIGGDGYGPVTMQQYNSWNGIVWRNDPDHCDVLPRSRAAEEGNVTRKTAVTAISNETVIRPALASIAGCMLMLSDKPQVYAVEANLNGLRRSSPVLFSVPGQLYDYDESKTGTLRNMDRNSIRSGSGLSPIDADQRGQVCPWWLNEIRMDYEQWAVLHRLNWSSKMKPATVVRLADLGLETGKEYLVYEFWTGEYVGTVRDTFTSKPLSPMGLFSYAIREKVDHPQLLSTSRHLSQGAVDIETLRWDGRHNTLSGRSRLIAEDEYIITLHAPPAYTAKSVEVKGLSARLVRDGEMIRISCQPKDTVSAAWKVTFEKTATANRWSDFKPIVLNRTETAK